MKLKNYRTNGRMRFLENTNTDAQGYIEKVSDFGPHSA